MEDMFSEATTDPPSRLGRSIAHLYRRSQIYLARELAVYGLSVSAYPPLLALFRKDGQSQEELALHAGVDKAAMKRAIDTLVRTGFVTREQNPMDRRAYKVHLTRRALDVQPDIEAALNRWEAVMTGKLDDETIANLRNGLTRMLDNVRRHAAAESLGSTPATTKRKHPTHHNASDD